MKNMRFVYRSTVLVLCIMVFAAFFPQQAFAVHVINTDATGSLTVHETYAVDNQVKNLKDVELEVWQVARVTAGAKFVLLDDWASSDIKINKLSTSGWQDAADALLAYAKANAQDIGAATTIKTGENGLASLSNLKTGLYLVAPKQASVRVPGYVVNLQKAFLVSVPYQVSEDSEWNYDVTVTPKNEAKPYTPPPTTISYTVTKVWQDNNDEAKKRPEQIYVRLLQNGNPYPGANGTVILQKDSWSYTWKYLPEGFKYSVEEVYVPSGYSSSVSGNTITNTIMPDIPEVPDNPDDPDDPSKPGRDNDGKPPTRPDGDNSRDSDGKFPWNNPKTGDEFMLMLWVCIAVAAGGGLFAVLRRNNKQ